MQLHMNLQEDGSFAHASGTVNGLIAPNSIPVGWTVGIGSRFSARFEALRFGSRAAKEPRHCAREVNPPSFGGSLVVFLGVDCGRGGGRMKRVCWSALEIYRAEDMKQARHGDGLA